MAKDALGHGSNGKTNGQGANHPNHPMQQHQHAVDSFSLSSAKAGVVKNPGVHQGLDPGKLADAKEGIAKMHEAAGNHEMAAAFRQAAANLRARGRA